MVIGFCEEKIRFGELITEDKMFHNDFAIVDIAWDTIPLDIRKRFAEKSLGFEPEFDDDWYYSAFVVALTDGILNLGRVYLYINEYKYDDNDIQEISKYINGNDTYLEQNFAKVELTIYEQTELAGVFLPIKDGRMRAS